MRPLLVVPLEPVANDPPRLLKCLERVLPDTLFFQTPKEPLDDPILLRRVRCNELLLQPIIPARLPKASTLEDQAVVAAEDRSPHGAQRAKPRETRRFHRPFGLLRPAAQRQLIADDLPNMTIDHGREMRPAVLATGNMRHIHRPPFVAPTRPTHPAPHARAFFRGTNASSAGSVFCRKRRKS